MGTKSLILGVQGNDVINKINAGKLEFPESQKLESLKQPTGWRSAQFDFLLEEDG